jgi:molecular chaperone DnaJ
MNYYETLGVANNASAEDIKKAFKKLAFDNHPDRFENDPEQKVKAETKFKEINAAFQTLSDPEKRQIYDFQLNDVGEPGFNPGFNPGNFGGINIEEFFRFFRDDQQYNAPRARSRAYTSPDAQVNLSLKDVLLGKQEEINLNLTFDCKGCRGSGMELDAEGKVIEHNVSTCSNCNGKGRIEFTKAGLKANVMCHSCSGRGKLGTSVCKECNAQKTFKKPTKITANIPPGVRDGNTMEMNVVVDGLKTTALIAIHITKHPLYTLNGNGDIKGKLKVTFPQAIMGGVFPIKLVDDTMASVRIPEGAGPGKIIKITGKGVPRSVRNQGELGDMFLEIELEIPTKLTDKQKTALEEFQKSLDEAANSN